MNPLLINRLSRIAFAACMIALPVAGSAGTNATVQNSGNPSEPGIEGTWVSRVVSNSTNPPTVQYSIATFLPGGQIVEENSGTTIRTIAQGEWQKVGPSNYERSMIYMTFNAPHTFSGFIQVSSSIQLNGDRDEFDAQAFVEVYDVNGNLTATRVNPSHAKRCTMGMTVPQCIGVAP